MTQNPNDMLLKAQHAIEICLEEMRDRIDWIFDMSDEELEEFCRQIHYECGTVYEKGTGTVPLLQIILELESFVKIIEKNYVSHISRTDRLLLSRVYKDNPYIRYIGYLEYEMHEKIWRYKKEHNIFPFQKKEKRGLVHSLFDFVKKLINEKILGFKSPSDLDPWNQALYANASVKQYYEFLQTLVLEEKRFFKSNK